jgi:hypothetical protein
MQVRAFFAVHPRPFLQLRKQCSSQTFLSFKFSFILGFVWGANDLPCVGECAFSL